LKISTIDSIPFLIYFILLLYFGFKAKRKNAGQDEYLLSGRSLSVPAFIATLVTTWYGGILGVGEFVYSYGISVWFVFGLPYYFFALLFAIFLAPKIRRADNYSIPDMLYQSYNKPVGLLGSFFLIIMTSPAPYILMLGILLQHICNISFFVSILFGTFFSIIYVYWGGFRSVVQTDKLQFVLMFSGFIILFIYLINSSVSLAELPQHLDAGHKSISGGLSWQNLIVWFLIASWTFIDPGFHQRCAAAKTPQTARKGIIISIAFWFVFDMLTMTTGLYAFVLLPDINPLMAYPQLAQYILPPFLKGLFFAGLLAIIMSTIDSYTFLSALTFGRDILWQFQKGRRNDKINQYVKAGLIITAFISIALIMVIPSVIELWYNLGSLFIPPLLIPLLAAYIPKLRLSSRLTFIIMAFSFSISFIFFLWGQFHIQGDSPLYPFGVEPFFPGFLCSIIWYSVIKCIPKPDKLEIISNLK
jgi:SSS family solute:Na+ symporter